MQRTILFMTSLIAIFLISCDNNVTNSELDKENTSWVFIANEGTYGASNGSISMVDDYGNIYQTDVIGDVVQSLEVYGNKLIVLINNSHIIKIYDITSDGLAMPGIEISTDGSSPRELVVVDNEGIENDKVYFTNWVTQDIKILNLFNYNIEQNSISVDGMPEDIMLDGTDLWVTINMNSDWSTGNKIVKIDTNTEAVTDIIEVGDGPLELTKRNDEIYVSRTYYDADWNPSQGASKIKNGILSTTKNYGNGGACGGAILNYNNSIYRSFEGGIVPLDTELNLELQNKIGNYQSDTYEIYHVEIIDGNIWFSLTDRANYNEVKVMDIDKTELATYSVGLFPGDFVKWEK